MKATCVHLPVFYTQQNYINFKRLRNRIRKAAKLTDIPRHELILDASLSVKEKKCDNCFISSEDIITLNSLIEQVNCISNDTKLIILEEKLKFGDFDNGLEYYKNIVAQKDFQSYKNKAKLSYHF